MGKDYKSLAEELKKYLGKPYSEGVATTTEKGVFDGIYVRPINGNTLHCLDEIVDFTRYRKLNKFVAMAEEWDSETNSYKNYIYCHIF